MRRLGPRCWARVTSGQMTAMPPMPTMNRRRCMQPPSSGDEHHIGSSVLPERGCQSPFRVMAQSRCAPARCAGAQTEQMFSGLCLKADARGIMRDGPRRRAEPAPGGWPCRSCAQTAATLHSQKDFRAPTHNPIDRGLWATDVHRLVIAPRIWDFAPKKISRGERSQNVGAQSQDPPFASFLKVSCDPWPGLRLSRIVGGPGYPRYQPGPFFFRRKEHRQ